MRLSICIITKNERDKLNRCLEALSRLDADIVVTDTGSSDDSVELARRYTDKVYSFEWCDDFSAARNYAVSKADTDMIMFVDSDEYVRESDFAGILKTIEAHSDEVGRINIVSIVDDEDGRKEISSYVSRIFDRRLYRYEGRIHEQIVRRDGESGYRIYFSKITADHDGYNGTPEERKAKAQRNIALLMEELKARPDDAYIMYQLGKSYFSIKDYTESVKWHGKATEYDLDTRLEWVLDMVCNYGQALVNAGRQQEALGLSGLESEFGHSSDYHFLMGVIYMNNEMWNEAVGAFLKAVKAADAKTKGKDSFLAYYNIGVIYEVNGDMQTAREYYGRCGDYPKALERLSS